MIATLYGLLYLAIGIVIGIAVGWVLWRGGGIDRFFDRTTKRILKFLKGVSDSDEAQNIRDELEKLRQKVRNLTD